MALSSMTTSLCNSLDQKFDSLVRPSQSTASGFKSQMRNFISQLQTGVYNTHSTITNALSTIENDVNNITPSSSMSDMNDLNSFLKTCAFMDGIDPVSALNGSVKGLFDQIDDWISNSIFDEIKFGSLADTMNNLLSSNNISNDLIQANRLISCLTSICGYPVASKVAIVDDLFTQYKLITNPLNPSYGNIDFDAVYTTAGLTSYQKEGMNLAVNGITSIKQNALTSVNNSVNKVKELVKIGGFF